MNHVSFDSLAHFLATAGSRRVLLGAVCAGVLGAVLPDRTDARKKPCPPCKKRKHGKCKKKKPDGTSCPEGTCRAGRCIVAVAPSQPPGSESGPTCSDGIRNGGETDLDCGGACARCADFKTCASRDDCRGALCVGDVCRVCDPAIANHCKEDAVGPCSCLMRNDSQRFCAQANFVTAPDCSECPTGTNCVDIGALNVRCFKLCGSS
jgi:hypothetical protein